MRRLLAERRRRVPPDATTRSSPTGISLAIQALADAGRVFGNTEWVTAAERAFTRIIELLWTGQSLHHSWRQGSARHHATADGYANLITAALALHAARSEPSHLDWAERLASALASHHWSETRGGYYFASDQATELLLRPFSAHDDATPNANGVMIGNLARLAILTGKDHYRDRAEIIHRRFSGELRSNPFGYASFMTGVLDLIDPIQLVTAGEADGSHLPTRPSQAWPPMQSHCMLGLRRHRPNPRFFQSRSRSRFHALSVAAMSAPPAHDFRTHR
jgi:uncharacterized protein YyaL (SSP411 family)